MPEMGNLAQLMFERKRKKSWDIERESCPQHPIQFNSNAFNNRLVMWVRGKTNHYPASNPTPLLLVTERKRDNSAGEKDGSRRRIDSVKPPQDPSPVPNIM